MLGLHRDSLVNLTALHHHSFDEDDKQIDLIPNVESDQGTEEDFIGLKIDDDEEEDDINNTCVDNIIEKKNIYNELNNLAIISTARDKMVVRVDSKDSSKDSSSSGFTDSEDDFDYEYYDSYTSGSVIWFENKERNKHNNLFECLFPCFSFLSNKPKSHYHHHHKDTDTSDDDEHDPLNTIPSNISDDERYGKPLTELQHQAVLARLNLPEVRSASMPAHHAPHHSLKQKPDEGAGPINEPKNKLKGILKRPDQSERGSSKSTSVLQDSTNRRSLFPTSGKAYMSKEKKNIKFISLAKVCTIPSLSSMSFDTRSNVWYQKGEYDDFKKAARIITKALLTGGSEIWLSETKDKDKIKDQENRNTFGSKWWCKFGHSRRGLEHLCNISEGRNRQKNVMQATKAVVDEYRRQRVVGHFDDKRLANVSRQYTSWARDLAHSTALADQEGVKKDFHPQAKSRNDYVHQTLLQHAHNNYDIPDCTITVGDVIGVSLPQQNSTSQKSNSKHDPHMLDAYTHSSMVYRKHQLKQRNHKDLLEQQRHQSDGSLRKKAAGFGVNGQNDISMPIRTPKIGVV